MRGRNRKGPNPLTRSFESNGGDVKIRGTALHIAEKYVQLARDAQSSGDRVGAENYLQHAEHYYRIVAAAQAQMPQPQPIMRTDDADDDDDREIRPNGAVGDRPQQGGQPAFGVADPQPYINGAPETPDGEGSEGRSEARGDRDQGGGRGGFRRRRPYRERYGDRPNGDSNNRPETSAEPPQNDEN
jgi:hypothetical protein